MEILNEYIVERPTGEIIWLTKKEKRMLSDFHLVHYDSGKNFWWFYKERRSSIENALNLERKFGRE